MFTPLAAVYFEKDKEHHVRIKTGGTTIKVLVDSCLLTTSGSWEKDNESIYVFQDYTPKDLDNDGQADLYEVY